VSVFNGIMTPPAVNVKGGLLDYVVLFEGGGIPSYRLFIYANYRPM